MKKLFFAAITLLVAAGCMSYAAEYSNPAELQANLDNVLLVDVRSPAEFAGGHIPGAVNIPHTQIAEIDKIYTEGIPVVLYCRSGNRSGIALDELKKLGYSQIFNFGGIGRWPYELATDKE